MNNKTPANFWNEFQKQWDALGPPLRPSTEDLKNYNNAINGWVSSHPGRPACAFVLGVTPEFPALNWPQGSSVYGLDSSIKMIRNIWPAQAKFAAGTVAMDWLAAPLRNASADVILGDGCFSLLKWPEGYRTLLTTIAGLLKKDGRLIMRFFVRPEINETPGQVFDDLAAGRIHGFHSFKWRLAMAMHGDNIDGVGVNDIWHVWKESGLTEEGVASAHAWPLEVVHTIEAYKLSEHRFSFPRLTQLTGLLGEMPGHIECHTAQYELGDRCPLITWSKPG